jgi:hypothetical protein
MLKSLLRMQALALANLRSPMQIPKRSKRFIGLLITAVLLASPLVAQQKRGATPKKPATAPSPEPVPTFDTLLSADTYRIYSEIRGVGQFSQSSAVNDLVDLIVKVVGPPKEFKTVVKWLRSHADALSGSRMLIAGWPARPNVPNFVMAIEFSSTEEAQKFYPELRGFLPSIMPTPAPTTAPGGASAPGLSSPGAARSTAAERIEPVLPYHLKQSGPLILLSDKTFTLRELTPHGSKLLAEDQNFALARNRFVSEPIFLYVDIKSIEKEDQERRQKWEGEDQRRIEREAGQPKHEELPNEVAQVSPEPPAEEPAPPAPVTSGSPQATLGTTSDPQVTSTATLSSSSDRGAETINSAIFTFYGALFGGKSKWPEAIGAAIAFEDDSYVVRTLIVNNGETKGNAIPFVPQFVSGPVILPESPGILPADLDLFVTASLDYPQIYEGMVKAIAGAEESSRRYRGPTQPVIEHHNESPFAVYEKKLGLKIKDDLLPLLGNELAFALLPKAPSASLEGPNAEQPKSDNAGQTKAVSADPIPVIAISVKDREGVRQLIPRIAESLGLKGANLLAQTEKRDDTELTSYANFFAYAFVGQFLVVSPDVAVTRHVVDSYLDHQTLSSDSHFKNFTRWQPRQVLGQVYVSPLLVKRYYLGGNIGAHANDKIGESLSGMNPEIGPLTYALSNDGLGPLHELHVPRNLLLLMIAGISNQASGSALAANEAAVKASLRIIASAEATYQATKGDGRFGSLDELIAENLLSKEIPQQYGYRIELTVLGKGFEAIAVPVTYGESGRLSYFIDETSVLRGGDHGGGAATVADQPL